MVFFVFQEKNWRVTCVRTDILLVVVFFLTHLNTAEIELLPNKKITDLDNANSSDLAWKPSEKYVYSFQNSVICFFFLWDKSQACCEKGLRLNSIPVHLMHMAKKAPVCLNLQVLSTLIIKPLCSKRDYITVGRQYSTTRCHCPLGSKAHWNFVSCCSVYLWGL